ncbi:MAG: hypothetical protein AAFV07_20290, partial [Bacteroidota bacterium]
MVRFSNYMPAGGCGGNGKGLWNAEAVKNDHGFRGLRGLDGDKFWIADFNGLEGCRGFGGANEDHGFRGWHGFV